MSTGQETVAIDRASGEVLDPGEALSSAVPDGPGSAADEAVVGAAPGQAATGERGERGRRRGRHQPRARRHLGRSRVRRPRGRSRVRRLLVVLGVIGSALALWWLGWGSPVTLVKHVVVQAPDGISEGVVRKASGIAATDHVPAIDAAQVRANILAALPAVAAVEVSRSLPSTVTVRVTARQPFAAVPRGGRFFVIDAGGVEFDEVGSAGKLSVLNASTPDGRQTARRVLTSLPETLRADVRTVTASTLNDVDLTLANGATVRWGSADQAALKAQVLAGLRSVKARHYDVSAPLMPTTSGMPTD